MDSTSKIKTVLFLRAHSQKWHQTQTNLNEISNLTFFYEISVLVFQLQISYNSTVNLIEISYKISNDNQVEI